MLAKRRAIQTTVGFAFFLAASSALAETYLVRFTAEIVDTAIRGGGSLPARYAVGEEISGLFEVDARRVDRIRGSRSDGRGAMQFTRMPKRLSFDLSSALSYSNGRLLVTGNGAARWDNAETYCKGYAAARRLFCTASGSIEVSQGTAGDTKRSYGATNFSLSIPGGMDPELELLESLEELASLASNSDMELVLGFSDEKRRADLDRVRLILKVTSMEFDFQ